MEQWLDIRQRVLREGVSKRQILRETGMHWTTLEKILRHPCPPGYQRGQRPNKPKVDPYLGQIVRWWNDPRSIIVRKASLKW